MRRPDTVTGFLLVLSAISVLLGFEFFSGMCLLVINYLSFKFGIKKTMKRNDGGVRSIKNWLFFAVILIKYLALGIITYLVLVTFDGSPVRFVAGFGCGLFLVTAAVVADNYQRRKSQ